MQAKVLKNDLGARALRPNLQLPASVDLVLIYKPYFFYTIDVNPKIRWIIVIFAMDDHFFNQEIINSCMILAQAI